MEYLNRIRCSASVDEAGVIVLGPAEVGFLGLPFVPGGDGLVTHKYLLESPGTGEWEIGDYRPHHQTPALRRVVTESSGVVIAPGAAGLIFSLIAPASALVVSYVQPGGQGSSPPRADSVLSVVAGGGSAVDSGSDSSTAIGVGARVYDESPMSVAVGAGATVSSGCPGSVSVGEGSAGSDYWATPGSTAVGAHSRATAPGESVLGSAYIPHVGFIPVKAPAGVNAGGTFDMLCVGGGDGAAEQTVAEAFAYRPDNIGGYKWTVRVTGVLTVLATASADYKSIEIDCMYNAAGVLYFNSTTLHSGANNPAVVFSLNAGQTLQVTAPPIAGLVIAGLLTVTKIITS